MHFAVQQKLTLHFRSIILQLKKTEKKQIAFYFFY